jgi:hypothetical protein
LAVAYTAVLGVTATLSACALTAISFIKLWLNVMVWLFFKWMLPTPLKTSIPWYF